MKTHNNTDLQGGEGGASFSLGMTPRPLRHNHPIAEQGQTPCAANTSNQERFYTMASPNDPYLEEAKRHIVMWEDCTIGDGNETEHLLSIVAYALVSIAESQADIAANSQYAP